MFRTDAASMRRVTRARHLSCSKKHMKQGVFREVHVGGRERFETQPRMPHASSACPQRCTATVGALRTNPGFPAPYKPDCAKLRKLDDPPHTPSRTVRTDLRPSRWSVMHRSRGVRSEEHTSELQSLMRISYAVFCLKKKTQKQQTNKLT